MDNKLVADYLGIISFKELDSMTEHHNRKVLPVSLSEAQLEAIDTAAKEAGLNRSEYIRQLFMKNVENFPDDLQHVGKYKRTPKK